MSEVTKRQKPVQIVSVNINGRNHLVVLSSEGRLYVRQDKKWKQLPALPDITEKIEEVEWDPKVACKGMFGS